MNIKILFVSLLLSMTCFTLKAQLGNIEGVGGTVLRETKYENVEGSPFLFPTYKAAKIFDRSGGRESVFAKYDSYKENVIVYNDGKPIILDPKVYGAILFDFIDQVTNENEKILFKNGYNISGYKATDYFQVMKDDGRFRFLKKIKTTRVDNPNASYGGVNQATSRFIRNETYFILDGSDVLSFNKISKNKILEMFGDSKNDSVYLKKNKNRLKSEEDVVSFLKYKENN